jgi:hypothetical protein
MDLSEYRNHGVSPLGDVEGTGGYDGKGVNLPTSTYENPGPTANIRGIEPNTNWDSGTFEPTYQVEVAGEMPVNVVLSPPFQVPMDQLGDVDDNSPAGWSHPDNTDDNWIQPEWPQVGSFTKFDETYPANTGRGLDG